jgi:hypothetical protein
MRSYLSLMQALGKATSQEEAGIALDDYADGFTLWGFDLTPDQGTDDSYWHLIRTGSVRIDAHFARNW